MSNCWKCGCETPEGVTECDNCREGYTPVFSFDDFDEEKEGAEFRRDFMQVDWTKVETLKDLIAILAEHGEPIFIPKDSPEFKQLEKFLKPIKPIDE